MEMVEERDVILMYYNMVLTVRSRVQNGNGWGDRDAGLGDIQSNGIGSFAAPNTTASWNNTAEKKQ